MWSHDEAKEIPSMVADMETVRCPECGMIIKKYVESHYTGGMKCVLLDKYCWYCGGSLENE